MIDMITFKLISTALTLKMTFLDIMKRNEVLRLVFIKFLVISELNYVAESKPLSIGRIDREELHPKSTNITFTSNSKKIYQDGLSVENTLFPGQVNERHMLIDSITPDEFKVTTADDLKFASDDLLTLDRDADMFIRVNITVMTEQNITRYTLFFYLLKVILG